MDFNQFVEKHCVYPDFPKKGVNFIDLFPILAEYGKTDLVDANLPKEKLIIVPEARGFLFFNWLNPKYCVPVRKHNLPGELIKIPIVKEYGEDTLYLSKAHVVSNIENVERTASELEAPIEVAIFDDILATGGTVRALIDQINALKVNGHSFVVKSVHCYIELGFLKGRDILKDVEVHSIHIM